MASRHLHCTKCGYTRERRHRGPTTGQQARWREAPVLPKVLSQRQYLCTVPGIGVWLVQAAAENC